MILPANTRHRDQIISLWQEAFGDKTEDIKKYLETIFKYFLVYEEDGIVKGMLSVLPVSFCGRIGGYVYAVATCAKYRGRGICNQLMEYVKADKSYSFLVLKPQNEGLFNFYGGMGFEKVACVSKKTLLCSDSKKNFELKKITSQEYENIRNTYFDEEIITWDNTMLSFAMDMYAGDFYAVEKNGNVIGSAFLHKDKDAVIIKELLTEEIDDVVDFIASELKCTSAKICHYDKNGDDGFLVYPKNAEKAYFNIYFD